MIEIRRLDLADAAVVEELVTLQRRSYAVEADLIGTRQLPPLFETAAQLARCGETFLGAHEQGLIGAISYKRRLGVLDIHRLVVDPGAFRRGIATQLLEALPRARRTVVSTAVANAPALALYDRHGFVAAGERTVPPGVQIVLLERRRRAPR